MSDRSLNAPTSSKKDVKTPRRRFVGSKTSPGSRINSSSVFRNQIPLDISEDSELNAVIDQVLPKNYSFEIHKTIWHVRKNESKMVALQMPEGLQMFACAIADIIERFTPALTTILGDVTYGACCVDDYTAVALGCDMLVHYGHSCLVPSNFTTPGLKTLYVFVEIGIDSVHVHETIRANLSCEREVFDSSLEGLGMGETGQKEIKAGEKIPVAGPGLRIELDPAKRSGIESTVGSTREDGLSNPTRLALVSTIQFVAALQRLKEDLSIPYTSPSPSAIPLWTGPYSPTIPRSKPLSPGEILGCTAPKLGEEVDAIVYLGDGRFHLEAIMIANPTVPAFRYDPYSKKLTRERYDHREMREVRRDAVVEGRKSLGWVEQAAQAQGKEEVDLEVVETKSTTMKLPHEVDDSAPLWGVILGTLGRQGSFRQLQAITNQLCQSHTPIPYMPILLSELSPAKLALFNARPSSDSSSPKTQIPRISTFIQTSCPRLSIDWGYAFERPLLSPYECAVVLGIGKEIGWMESKSEEQQKAKSDSEIHYPMDFYAAGSPWALSRVSGVLT
ncbi:hypothetical protein GYMLUDRAFT_38978 [Collybiopsis luxurians FD-317 M1]|nr:hypothetical protein GYMLUDRAFT_38978 [Collybiopsis luxurians FD-317 M1]